MIINDNRKINKGGHVKYHQNRQTKARKLIIIPSSLHHKKIIIKLKKHQYYIFMSVSSLHI